MKYTKLLLIILIVTILTALTTAGYGDMSLPEPVEREVLHASASVSSGYIDSQVDYEEMEKKLAELRKLLNQPNILKSDIERGFYVASESEKRYGTPESWVFVEDGDNSRWVSQGVLEEEHIREAQSLCLNTGGEYYLSCLDSSDPDCEYAIESYCECRYSSSWNDEQGCVLTGSRGTFVAITPEELEEGRYAGTINEKKLNTPSGWFLEGEGRDSFWRRP